MLEIKQIVKTFGDNVALNNISFSVTPGRIFGLLGRNGAGKSTMFRIILNILKEDSGSIFYDDEKITENISDKIGYLPEEGSLILTYTVLEQLLYYGALKKMREDEIKKQAFYWLGKFNILEYLNMKIKDLSKGNRQKIQFIVSVLHNPQLIILDEPFSGLDPISVEEFKKIIIELKNQNKMIIFSSHRMDQVEMLCDDILILDKGNTVLVGSLDNIKNMYKRHEINITGNIGKYTLDVIKGLNDVSCVEVIDENNIKVKVEQKDVISKIFNILKSSNITNFYTTQISLNDIFIDKVGKNYE